MLDKKLLQGLIQEKVNNFRKEVSPRFLDEWVDLVEPINGFGDKKILSVFVKRWGVGVVVQDYGIRLLERFIFEELVHKQVADLHLVENMIDNYLFTLKRALTGGEYA